MSGLLPFVPRRRADRARPHGLCARDPFVPQTCVASCPLCPRPHCAPKGIVAQAALCPKLRFSFVPVGEARKWSGAGGFIFEEKVDGRTWCGEAFGSVLVGERVGGDVFAFDVLCIGGQDLRARPLRERLACLDGLVPRGRARADGEFVFRRPVTGNGGEFVEVVLARGGEGVVAKRLDGMWGDRWFKTKKSETFDLLVVERDIARGSVRLVCPVSGEERGWCPARASILDLKVGDVVEVAAYGLTVRGRLREPRFVRTRPDKNLDSFVHGHNLCSLDKTDPATGKNEKRKAKYESETH